MPKVVDHRIVWLAETAQYVVCETEQQGYTPVTDQETAWFTAWLTTHTSFAFQGQRGHLTLRKEVRTGNTAYWYAYRCQRRRTVKRYVGHTDQLTIARLEEVASAINAAFLAPSGLRIGKGKPSVSTALAERTTSLLPLLTAKFCLPQLPHALIIRERLLTRLDGCLEQPVTLLCAPAGFGKTTLMRQWLTAYTGQDTILALAWVTLDASDNDPLRFWHALMTATQHWTPSSGRQHLIICEALTRSDQPCTQLEAALTIYLNELARQDGTGLLILDDYQFISEARIHETLSFFLTHLPAHIHLVLLSRFEPPVALARIRANGALNEIRTTDLRFSLGESALLFQKFSLSPEMLEQLDSRLEGWAAGLRLLRLALQDKTTQPELEQTLGAFTGSYRSIHDYFVTEVLHQQSPALQAFLLRTADLPRFTPELCSLLVGQQEGVLLLEQLKLDGLFLHQLDNAGSWYRYHPLFAEALQHEARLQLSKDERNTILQVASCWFEQQELLPEAIEVTLSAHIYQRATTLMERFFQSPEIHTYHNYRALCRWLESLPPGLLQASPTLCFGYAVVLRFDRTAKEPDQRLTERIEAFLHLAEESWRARNDLPRLGAAYAFRAFFFLQQGLHEQAAALATQALAWLPAENTLWRGLSLSALGLYTFHAGQLIEARYLFEQVELLTQQPNSAHIVGLAQLFLGNTCFEQGHLHLALRHYQRLTDATGQTGEFPAAIFAELPRTQIFYEWNEPTRVQDQIQKVLTLIERNDIIPQDRLLIAIELLLARVQHAQGETALAIQRLEALFVNTSFPDDYLTLHLYQDALSWLIRLSLLAGDLGTATHWLNTLNRYYQGYQPPSATQAFRMPIPTTTLPSPPAVQRDARLPIRFREQKALLVARVALEQNRPESTLHILSTLLSEAQSAGRGQNVLQMRLLMAQAHAACQQPDQARQWLLQALEQGYPENYKRSFLDEGERLARLLRDLLPHLHGEPLHAYVQTLLQDFARPSYTTIVTTTIDTDPDQLSAQEQRVLHLLAAGRSNPEIARELVVSVNTIHTQVQSIYRKLNVHSRHAAMTIARQRSIG